MKLARVLLGNWERKEAFQRQFGIDVQLSKTRSGSSRLCSNGYSTQPLAIPDAMVTMAERKKSQRTAVCQRGREG